MPLTKKNACSQQTISENIAREVRAGKDRKQAAAIAYSVCERSKRKAKR